ncbi:MAG: CHAT domain-containing protein [Bradyrhizobiaceae bacterium]|nr:CHAT domain-containing protein [Bradyrhizobiaceae bacterium]
MLVTLWPLDDQFARGFMVGFYKNLLIQKRRPDEGAARYPASVDQADHNRSDPGVWAPYVLIE